MEHVEIFFYELEKHLPPVFARKEVSKLTGGLVAPHTLANADSEGRGPAGKIRIGRQAAYTKDNFLAWLKLQVK